MSDDQDQKAVNLQNRALGTMISSAFFTWQSAVIIALTIIFFGLSLPPLNAVPILWLAAGAVAEALYLVATITDPRAQQRVIQQMLAQKYNPASIRNPGARARLNKALEYHEAMQRMMLERVGATRVEFQRVLDDVDDWIAELYALGQMIDRFDENTIINRDRMQARNELDALNRRLNAEPDERVKEELRRSIEIKKTQFENLASYETTIKRADILMDNTLAAMGTVYAQMQLSGSKKIDRSAAQRLRNDIHENVMSLQDMIATIDEVQGARSG